MEFLDCYDMYIDVMVERTTHYLLANENCLVINCLTGERYHAAYVNNIEKVLPHYAKTHTDYSIRSVESYIINTIFGDVSE